MSDNFNNTKFDRRKWYTINYGAVYDLVDKRPSELADEGPIGDLLDPVTTTTAAATERDEGSIVQNEQLECAENARPVVQSEQLDSTENIHFLSIEEL